MIKDNALLRSRQGKNVCSTYSIQYCTGGSSDFSRQEKKIKDMQIKKEKIKLSLFMDNMVLYIENAVSIKAVRNNKRF